MFLFEVGDSGGDALRAAAISSGCATAKWSKRECWNWFRKSVSPWRNSFSG